MNRVVIIPIVYPWLVHDQISLAIASFSSRINNYEVIFVVCDGKTKEEECEIIYNERMKTIDTVKLAK